MKAAYIGVFLVSVLIASVSQILLKQSADGQYESKVKEYLNIMRQLPIYFCSHRAF